MNINCLKMNVDSHQLIKSTVTSLTVNNTEVDVHLDKNLNFKKHITANCKVASFNHFRIRNIRKYLMVHLEYAIGLFLGLPEVDII